MSTPFTTQVIRHKLVLGARHATTGQRDVSYQQENIDMILGSRGSAIFRLIPGLIAIESVVGVCADVVKFGDLIEQPVGTYYLVTGVQKIPYLNTFLYRVCQLAGYPLHKVA